MDRGDRGARREVSLHLLAGAPLSARGSRRSTPPPRRRACAPPEAGEAGRKTSIARANARALALAPVIAEIQANGVTRPHAIAMALTHRGVPTVVGHRFWSSGQVRKVLDRLAWLAPSVSAEITVVPNPKRAVIFSETTSAKIAGKVIISSQASRRGRPTASGIVGQILSQMRMEGASLCEPPTVLTKMVAARNGCALGDRSWDKTTILKHVGNWLHENPDPNDYRIVLTLKEAARDSGIKRALLAIAIGQGTLPAYRYRGRTLIPKSDLQRFVARLRPTLGADRPR
jgi:excisionase family DNA binding protein